MEASRDLATCREVRQRSMLPSRSRWLTLCCSCQVRECVQWTSRSGCITNRCKLSGAMSKEAIAVRRLEVRPPRRAFARLSERRLQFSGGVRLPFPGVREQSHTSRTEE